MQRLSPDHAQDPILDIVPSKVSLSLIFPLSASTPPAGALACAQRATVTGQQCAGGVGSRRAAEDQVMPALVYSHCDASRNRRPTQSANRIYRGAAGGAVAVAKSGAHLRRQETCITERASQSVCLFGVSVTSVASRTGASPPSQRCTHTHILTPTRAIRPQPSYKPWRGASASTRQRAAAARKRPS